MGLLRKIKFNIVKKSVIKNAVNNPFDIGAADNYVLPADAVSRHNNSHYFIMFNQTNDEMMYLRTGRRGGKDTQELWFVYRDANGNVFLQDKDHTESDEYYPIKVDCVKAGQTMTFEFDGFVVPAEIINGAAVKKEGAKPVKAVLNGTFSGETEPFEFSFHMDPKTMANAMSREKFNKSFQDTMHKIHQVHYEQSGTATATINIGGKESKMENFLSIRDHSYGKREWDYFDRYIWSIAIMENGEFLHTSLMRYPALSNLKAGFYKKDGKTVSLFEATELDKMPVVGDTPDYFECEVEYIDGTKKLLKVTKQFVVNFVFDDGFMVNEGFCNFEVDGVKGKGIAEFAFNADESRWRR